VSLTLVRLDDRLIHGQVVVGWGNALGADRILLIDDHVAVVPWERDLYRLGVPPSMEVEFASVEDAPAALDETVKSSKRVIVVIADIDTLVRVCRSSDAVRRVNIGGLHEGEGRRRRLRYVFLSEEEGESLRMLEANGVEVTARDVPSAKAVPLSEFL
jgi:PTS system mannose-specific IIB component/fructoselysine and glucoselysine-specific PTS system IIB component